MKKRLLTALTFFLIFTANAQWQVQNPGFTSDSVGFYEMSLPDKTQSGLFIMMESTVYSVASLY